MLEKVALFLVGAAVVAWGISQGSFLFPALIALAVFSQLRRGAWRPHARALSWSGAGASLALYLGAALICFAALAWFTILLPPDSAVRALEDAATVRPPT
jgi:hypothetical protein